MKLFKILCMVLPLFFFSINSEASKSEEEENDAAAMHSYSVDVETNWIVLDDHYRTKDGYIIKCTQPEFLKPYVCNPKDKMLIQSFIETKVGNNYRAVRIEPHFDRFSNYSFLVIYYKLKVGKLKEGIYKDGRLKQ